MTVREPDIAVVIPLYNKAGVLERCLGSVARAAAADGGVSVTVVDNGSTDGSRTIAERILAGRGTLVTTPGCSIAAVRNAGARMSRGPVLAFIDADCVVPEGYFAALRRVLADESIAGAGRWVDLPEDASWIERAWHRLHRSRSDGFRPFINSANFAVRRQAFDAVGAFDESLTTGEDAELGLRLTGAGLRLFESPELAVLHIDNPRTMRAFFRKEVWHALGMFGTVRRGSIDRPTAMMLLHLVLLAAAAWTAAVSGLTPALRVGAVVTLSFLIPAATVMYRLSGGQRGVAFLPAMLLYQLYYLARLTALGVIVGRRLVVRRGRRAQ